MTQPTPLTRLCMAAALALTTCGAPAQANPTEPVTLPPDIAMVEIADPREGQLLYLRGIAGRGTALLRIKGHCHRMSVRFVAGDFRGARIDVAGAHPIRLLITDQHAVRSLSVGHDLVSDTVRVSTDRADRSADVFLASGLTADTGFIVNAGGNLAADVMGPRLRPVSCTALERAMSDLLP